MKLMIFFKLWTLFIILSFNISVNTEDGSTTEQIYKGRKKQKSQETDWNQFSLEKYCIGYKNLQFIQEFVLVCFYSYSFLFLEDSVEKMYNLVSFLKWRN